MGWFAFTKRIMTNSFYILFKFIQFAPTPSFQPFVCPPSDIRYSCLNGSWRLHCIHRAFLFSSDFSNFSFPFLLGQKFYLFFKGFWDPHNASACEAFLSYDASFQAETIVTSLTSQILTILIIKIQYLMYWIIVTGITWVSLKTYQLI